MTQDATTPADTPEAFMRGLLRHAQRELARAARSDDALGRAARLLREGHHQAATDGLEALVQSDDAPAPSHYFLGLCRLLVGRHNDAAACFSQAIERGCRPPEVVQALGDALFLLERYDEAVSAYDVVLTRHASAEAYARKGQALTRLRREDEAIAAFKESLRLKLATVASMDGTRDLEEQT